MNITICSLPAVRRNGVAVPHGAARRIPRGACTWVPNFPGKGVHIGLWPDGPMPASLHGSRQPRDIGPT
jgi:hypothetical protein